jgi:hypothetical protein
MAIRTLSHTYRYASVRILAARLFTSLLLLHFASIGLSREKKLCSFDFNVQKNGKEREWVKQLLQIKGGHFVTHSTPFLENPRVVLLRQRKEVLLYEKKRHYEYVFVFFLLTHTLLSVR